MKNSHSIVLTLLSMILFIGCDKSEDNLREESSIEITTPEVLITTDGGNNTISFTTNEDWTAHIINSSDNDWCKIHPTSGSAGNVAITITTTPNDTPDDRTASIEIKAGTVSETLTISQKQKDAIIISNNYINVEKEGETIEVKINSNVDFELQIPSEATWIELSETRALVENSVYLKVLPNDSDVCRNTNISVANKDSMLCDTLVILQQGNKTSSNIAYSEDQEELEGWSAGLFGGEGTYIMGKQHLGNGYIMTIGNILAENITVVYMDEYKRIREIFTDNTAIAFEYNNNGGVDISIIERGQETVTEHISYDSYTYATRLGSDHNQEVGIINLALNIQGMYDAAMEIAKSSGFSKKGTILFLANYIDSLRNLVKALGGPDIFNENFSNWLGTSMNVVGLAELAGMYGSSGLLGPIGAVISSYAGLYSTYLELYDEHIEAYFGNCHAEISGITSNENKLNIDVAISGYESWYNNIECGVVVKEKSNFAPKYTDGASIQPVTKNGDYVFVEGGIQINTTYSCRPFVIDKNRASLWKGFIGDMVGPLVRYGKVQDIEIHCSVATGDCVSTTETSATVKCSYTNVSGLECGVCISSDDETQEFPANGMDGEQEINLSGLRPATTYNYWAFINVNGEYINGQVKSFTTDLPDVTGTWTCKETHYKNNGQEYYTTYTVTLHNDGTVTTSKYDSFASATWSRSKTGLSVRIHVATSYFTGSYWAGSDVGYDLSITFDDPANPTSGKGFAHQWAVSAATGIGSDYYYDLEMTR